MDKWEGPFGENAVRGFLAHMREGATIELFRTRTLPGIEEAELLGWFQRNSSGRFVGLTASGNVLGSGLNLGEAVAAFLELEPQWALHNVAWRPKRAVPRPDEVGPVLREAVREVVGDKASGGSKWLELRKKEHWRGDLYDWGLADAALTTLGYPDKTAEVSRALAPTVAEAFETFKRARPDLEPW